MERKRYNYWDSQFGRVLFRLGGGMSEIAELGVLDTLAVKKIQTM